MEFCPTCGTMLKYELPHVDHHARFACPSCPYVCNMASKVKLKRKQPLGKKEIQPIFTQDSMFEGPQIEVICPSCKFGKAVYHELQTWSADEPMTIFYMCANKNRKHRWNE
ncbi:hypothetical protein ACOSQ2_017456 [Xanthoceras sorbifolium]